MSKIRYLAEWVVEQGTDGNGDADPYKDEHGTKEFPATPGFDRYQGDEDPQMEAAAKYGCEQNCYGSECFVYVQSWGYDGGLYEDTGRKSYSWWDEEKYLCQDGRVLERVD